MIAHLDDLPPLDQDDYKPLYAQLTDALLEFIETKKLKPGDPFPSEANLIKHYGISRITVRLAIQRLATDCILTKKQGVGTFVAGKKISSDLQGLKSIDEKLKQQGIEVDNVLLDAGVSDHVIEFWTSELGLMKRASLFKLRRLKKVNGYPFALEIRFVPPSVTRFFDFNSLTGVPLIELLNTRSETMIARVSYRTRSESLLEYYATELGVEPGSAGLVQFATYFNNDDKPVLTGKLIFLGEKMELRHEMNFLESSQIKDRFIPEVSPLDQLNKNKPVN